MKKLALAGSLLLGLGTMAVMSPGLQAADTPTATQTLTVTLDEYLFVSVEDAAITATDAEGYDTAQAQTTPSAIQVDARVGSADNIELVMEPSGTISNGTAAEDLDWSDLTYSITGGAGTGTWTSATDSALPAYAADATDVTTLLTGVGSGQRTANIAFSLKANKAYNDGTYTGSMVYTLTNTGI